MDINKFVDLVDTKQNIIDYLVQKYLKEDKNNQKILNRSMVVYGHITDMCERGLLTEDEKGDYIILRDICKDAKEEDWKFTLYTKIENLIFELTKKKNFINKSGKYLKPPLPIFKQKMEKFQKMFKITDKELISKTLLKYVKDVINKKIEYPIALEYLFLKQNNGGFSSELLNLIENYEEDIKEEKNNTIFDGVNI